MSIGSTIKRLRREKDITQEQLAEYLGIRFKKIFHEVFVEAKYSFALIFKDIIAQKLKYIKLHFLLSRRLRLGQA